MQGCEKTRPEAGVYPYFHFSEIICAFVKMWVDIVGSSAMLCWELRYRMPTNQSSINGRGEKLTKKERNISVDWNLFIPPSCPCYLHSSQIIWLCKAFNLYSQMDYEIASANWNHTPISFWGMTWRVENAQTDISFRVTCYILSSLPNAFKLTFHLCANISLDGDCFVIANPDFKF